MLRVQLDFDSIFVSTLYNESKVFTKQIRPVLDTEWNGQDVVIVYPEEVRGVSIMFIKGLVNELIASYGKDTFFDKFSFEAGSEYLTEKINKYIHF